MFHKRGPAAAKHQSPKLIVQDSPDSMSSAACKCSMYVCMMMMMMIMKSSSGVVGLFRDKSVSTNSGARSSTHASLRPPAPTRWSTTPSFTWPTSSRTPSEPWRTTSASGSSSWTAPVRLTHGRRSTIDALQLRLSRDGPRKTVTWRSTQICRIVVHAH